MRGEERLLELLLAHTPEAERELARLRLDPHAAAELAALEGFLGTCKTHLDEPLAAERTTALAERVLARTVLARTVLARTVGAQHSREDLSGAREDISIRGDLRLLHGFVRERMRSSVVLRLVAASLLLHLMALPVLAWVLLVQKPSGPLITFEPPHEPLVEPAVEPPIELVEDALELEDLLGEPVPAGDNR